MKLRCPRCEQKLTVPDKYAGRAIRCPACNRGFNVPKLEQATGPMSEIDLTSLAMQEAGTQQLTEEEREQLEMQASGAEPTEPGVRVCPYCKAKTKSADPTLEILCAHCWKTIPATQSGGGLGGKKIKAVKEIGAFGRGGFYSELGNAVSYPMSAFGSIITAALVAFLAGVLPVLLLTGAANAMNLSKVGTSEEGQAADLTGVPVVLSGVFLFEIIFFSAVAIHAFFDIVRATGIGEDQAPKLTWSPNNLAKSVVSYLVLLIYVAFAMFVVANLTLSFDIEAAIVEQDASKFMSGGTAFLVGMIIVCSLIPMQLIGMSLGNVGQAMNIVKVAKSIGYTHVHYLFLVLVLSVFGSLFGIGFLWLLFFWFIPKVSVMIEGSEQGQLGQVALALLAWGLVMACFFYGSYILARLHGLFVRSFRKKLLFGTT